MTVSTIYAVAQCGLVTSNSNITWANVRDSTTGNTASQSPATMLTHARFFSSAYTLYQSFLQFDTSVVTGVVTAPATLYLYAASINGSDTTDGQSVFTVYDFGTSITTADLLSRSEIVTLGYYGSIGWPESGVGYYGGSSESLASYAQDNNTTRVAVVPARQFTDTPPAGDNYVVWGATAGSDGDPYLTVQWGIVTGTATSGLTGSATASGTVERGGTASFSGSLTASLFRPGTYYGSAAAVLGITPTVNGYVQDREYYRRLSSEVTLINDWTRYSVGVLGGATTTADPVHIIPNAAMYLKPAFELNTGATAPNVSRISDITLKQMPDETMFSGIQPSAIVGVNGNVVGTGGNQLISGYKTFQVSPIILNQPINDTDAVNKLYVDQMIANSNILELLNPSNEVAFTPVFTDTTYSSTPITITNSTIVSRYQVLNSKWCYIYLSIKLTGAPGSFAGYLAMDLPVAPHNSYVAMNVTPASTIGGTSDSLPQKIFNPIFGGNLNPAINDLTAEKSKIAWIAETGTRRSGADATVDFYPLASGYYPLAIGSGAFFVSRFVYRTS